MLVTTSDHAILFVECTLGANLTLLLLDNHIEGNRYAVYFFTGVVDGGGIIVKGNALSTTARDEGVESSVCVNGVAVRNGGYFDVENNTMSAGNGVRLYGGTTVSSAGLLRVTDCTFIGATSVSTSALLYLSGSVTLEGGAQLRVEGNNVSAASVLTIPYFQHKIQLSGSGTAVVFAHNGQVGSRVIFAKFLPSSIVVKRPAQFVVGCNMHNDEEASYDGLLPEGVVVFSCGTCNDDAACYMPGTELVDRGSCSCSCKDGWHGASCL
ncbi:dispersed gene family protein 1 (DGF-1), putative, partial [Trypanosoma cruzi marinkellei]